MRRMIGIMGAVLVVFLGQPAQGATWYVDGLVSQSGDGSQQSPFETIQEGIDAASDGDIVIVADWTYVENVGLKGKNIVLRSTDPLDPDVVANTIIDRNQSGSVVTFDGTEDGTCLLSGFTVRNGKASEGGGILGGTPERRTLARIQNNTIIENSVTAGGGGLARCDGTIQNNLISGNSAPDGGGLAVCGGLIQNNLIIHNSATGNGGGLMYCDGTIQGNTICYNSASRGWGGGGFMCFGVVLNCIIWGNSAGAAGPQVYNLASPTYCCIQDWVEGGIGNIADDPLFVDAAADDYHLQWGSPCVDAAGGVSFHQLSVPQRDFDGNCRLSGKQVDIGCYEWGSSLDSDGDLLSDSDEAGAKTDPRDPYSDADSMIDGLEVLRGANPLDPVPERRVLHVPSSIATIRGALSLAVTGDEIIVAPGTYLENAQLFGFDVVLRSSDPHKSGVVASTVIDGRALGPVVMFTDRESEACVLSGFTIRNGKANQGGGICGGVYPGRPTRATIENNTITENSATYYGGGLARCDGTVRNNIICRNSAKMGGGLALCCGAIQHNVIMENSAEDKGGALYGCKGSIRNCIIWKNTPSRLWDADCNPMSFCCGEVYGGLPGNVSEDPQFIDAAAGDYRLKETSPCIDAGIRYYWSIWPERDRDGNCRLRGPSVDIGCYEFGASPDADGDLLSDTDETVGGTDPYREDTDGDGLRDGLEAIRGSDPLNPTAPQVFNVPESVSPIQKALCLAIEGDVVVLAPRTYQENLEFCGPDLTLRSSDPLNAIVVASTILDGGGARAIVFKGRETPACVLSGVTVRNGNGEWGGGIAGNGTHATIENNTIAGNHAWEGGGLEDCDGCVQKNVVSGNSAAEGGALANCDGVIESNAIIENSVTGYGSALCSCHGDIRENVIARNAGDSTVCDCDGTIENNVVTHNSASGSPGLYRCDGTIQNNLIAHNSALGWPGGGAIMWCGGTIRNNTIAFNSREHYSGSAMEYCSGQILNCIIWGNADTDCTPLRECEAPSGSCIEDWTGAGEANITSDPKFLDPDGPDDDPSTYEDNDYRLSPCSPCIDKGLNEDWMLEATDLDSQPRIANGRVDMGTFEFQGGPRLIIIREGEAAALEWGDFGNGSYTVEWRDHLMQGAWQPASGNWPISEQTWNDVMTQQIMQRFYRVESAGIHTDPVGFIRVFAVDAGLTLLSVPLAPVDDRLNGEPGCIGDMLKEIMTPGAGAAQADLVFKWNAKTQTYRTAYILTGVDPGLEGKWWDEQTGALSTMTLDVGEGFWLLRTPRQGASP